MSAVHCCKCCTFCVINLHAGTFHVQSITTTKLRDRTCVICNFAQGSTASGCHIRFMDAMHGDREVKAIDAIRIPQGSLTSSNCADGLPSGVFRVLASDISSTGVEDYRVAVVGSSLITVLEIATLMPTSQQQSSKPVTRQFKNKLLQSTQSVYPLCLSLQGHPHLCNQNLPLP